MLPWSGDAGGSGKRDGGDGGDGGSGVRYVGKRLCAAPGREGGLDIRVAARGGLRRNEGLGIGVSARGRHQKRRLGEEQSRCERRRSRHYEKDIKRLLELPLDRGVF